jgi:magnesium transporter
MSNELKNIARSVGRAPGSLIYIGDTPDSNVSVSIIEYNRDELKQYEAKTVAECLAGNESSHIRWINLDGVHNVEIIQALGEQYGLHPLVLEDVLNTELRPKIEFFDTYVFVLLKMLAYNEQSGEIEAEQVSLILGNGYVISLQEGHQGDVFDPVRNRLKTPAGKLRKSGADFLLYSLVDTVVDHCFLLLEKIGERQEALEDAITRNPTQRTLKSLYDLRQDLIFLRRHVWPLREVVSGLEREETPLIRKETRKYIRDIYDHTIQVIDTTESYRETLASLLDIYLSSISNKTNDVMKVLTIISTIFMPLTFIVGIYGMNFDNMPELRTRYGYFVVLGVMGLISLMMILFFKRKRWL